MISRDRRGIIGAIIAVIVVVIIIIAVLTLIVVPFREVKINESRQIPLEAGTDALNLTLSLDVGSVEVRFVDDATNAISMTVVGTQRYGLLGSGDGVNVTWLESSEGDELSVSSNVNLGRSVWPFSASNVNCTVTISNQLRTALTITDSLGSVDVRAGDGVELTSVNIKASTGGARVELAPNSTLSGPLSLEASLGGVELLWTDVSTTDATSVNLTSNTGGVRATIDQSAPLNGTVRVGASANLGGVDLGMDLSGNNSAQVTSTANLGGVNVQQQEGFNGTSGQLSSENYPSASRFDVTCSANAGGVNLRLRYAE